MSKLRELRGAPMGESMRSPEGQQTAADVEGFASGGATVLLTEIA